MHRLLYAVFGILIIQDICLDVVSCDSSHVGVDVNNKDRGYSGVKRRARRDDLPTIHIETVVILDEDYIHYLNQLGHTTDEQMTETIQLKWNGVQAEFGKAAVFGYHIYINIKLIEFWHKNPHRTDRRERKAYTGRICNPQRKCAVSAITRVTEYVISTHELGHSLGMSHDSDVGCSSPNDGIMGSKTSGWSECSINATLELLQGQTAGCLFETNVAKDTVIALTEAWPGMSYTDDELCELQHGSGYIFRPFPYSWGQCSLHTCWNTNTTSPDFNRNYNHFFPNDGRYCGHRKVCSSEPISTGFRCITWEETGLDLALFEQVTGGWSDWSKWSECGRTCGTGVRYRKRLCDNPRPKNSPTCNGSSYDAVLCNKEPCEDDNEDERSLIQQRASDVCAALKVTSWYSSDTGLYLSTGDRYHNQYDGHCEVRCETVPDYSAPTFKRYGLMPDGTPCSSLTESLVEKHKLPRNSGVSHHCVQGLCYDFDCEGYTDGEVRKDECGVCGGDNTTCDYTHGLFNTTMGEYVTETIVELPPEAFLIQFYFDYNNMEVYLMELWTEDSRAIISPWINNIFSTEEVPVTWAGTRWHYDYTVQYLYADDAINTTAVVKVISDGNNENMGIFFSFSVPKDTGVTVGENCTNTFCRDAFAVCDVSNRCTCKTGYDYNTTHCADTDECSEGDLVCVNMTSGGRCSNTEGSFVCSCIEGFTGNGYSVCEDVDECNDTDLNTCVPEGLGGRCVNTLGSYTCSCADGSKTCSKDELPVFIQSICIGTYTLLIVLVFIHSVFYFGIDSCTSSERVYSYISMAICVIILARSILYLIAVNIDLDQNGCKTMSLFIQCMCVGCFIVVWIESVTACVLIRLYKIPRYLIPIAVFMCIGIATMAVIIHAIMTNFDGFYLQRFCWYDIGHAAFKTSSIIITIICIFTVVLNITLIYKVKTDSKDPSERLQQRFHRSLLRRNIVYILWQCIVWVLQVMSANYQTFWIQVVFLVVLIIEGLGLLGSRLYLFSYICRKTVLKRKTKDIDHIDSPDKPAEPGTCGDTVIHTELGAQYKADTADVFLEVDGVTHI